MTSQKNPGTKSKAESAKVQKIDDGDLDKVQGGASFFDEADSLFGKSQLNNTPDLDPGLKPRISPKGIRVP